VAIVDDPPTASCPFDQTELLDSVCVGILGDYTNQIVATDVCDDDINLVITQSPLPGSIYNGKQEVVVVITVTDGAGNVTNCGFTVFFEEGVPNTCLDPGEVKIPSGYSPNGDFINDAFVIEGLEYYPNNELTVYNRWGNVIYQASPYVNDWKGSSQKSLMGDIVVDGSYYYILKLKDDIDPLTGYVVIKR